MKQRHGVGYIMTQARLRAGLTQRDLAELMRTTATVIAKWETGRALPNVNTLEMLAAVTGNRLEIRMVAAQGRKASISRKATRRLVQFNKSS